jgi:gluconate 5-dehydrogenase
MKKQKFQEDFKMSGILDKFRLDGKVAWVTGASYGLGLAYAKAFAEAGAKVVFNDINEELVEKGRNEYAKLGIEAYGAVCDVTNEEAVNAFVADVKAKIGTIDILVNNAGIIKRIPMHEMSKAQWDQVINVDLTGPFVCSKAVIPDMIEKKSGKIINACSMMSEFGRETVSAYAAAKGGLKMLTRNICSEYGQYNIQCNAIGPGYIATPQTAPLRARGEDGKMAPFDRFIRSKTPAQRWGKTEDLQGLAVFLASPASDFINGQVVYIDGGISAYIGQDPSNLDESKFAAIEEDEFVNVLDK